MKIEYSILKSLIFNEEYTKKVLPFIKSEYFHENAEKHIFTEINNFVMKYNNNPSYEALLIQISEKSLVEDEYNKIIEILEILNSTKEQKYDEQWLLDKTETFCQDQAIYNGVVESISILDGKNKLMDKGAIPKLLEDALSVSFNNNIGVDYLEDFADRYESYIAKEDKIPFDLEYFNKITNEGLPKGTLTVFAAGTGKGKSLVKAHLSSHYIQIGKNVLYITLEMSEIAICKRIDANILNIDINQLDSIEKNSYYNKIGKVKEKGIGKLIVKQYPTCGASVLHFQHLINELRLKKNFVADVLMIDYLNICASSRMKMNGSVNSYSYIKSIAEELRGLAIYNNIPIITSTQFNRKNGESNSDPGIDDISDSAGISMTADLLLGIIRTEELDNLNQILFKQIKNRFNDLNTNKRFVVGINRPMMKLYDLEQSAQFDIIDSGQDYVDYKNKEKSDKNKFEGFKF